MKNSMIAILILIGTINVPASGQQLHRTGLLFENVTKVPSIKKAVGKKISVGLPSAVDNSVHLPPIGNQGVQNSCVAWAIGYYYKTYQEWQDYGWNITDPNWNSIIDPDHVFSPSFIYNQINGGRDAGAYFSDALKLLCDNGCATMADFPIQTDITSWPSESAYRDAVKYRSLDAYYIQAYSMADIEQVKQLLASGNIAVLGIAIYANFDTIKSFNNTYCVKDKAGNSRGGHAVTIVGYDDNETTADGAGAFRLVNQWGTNWGDNGFFWMSYQAVMDTCLSQRIVCYTTDRIHYKPSIIASIRITHPDKNLLNLTLGIGSDGSPKYSKNYFDFWVDKSGPSSVPFPGTEIDFDLSDGLNFIDTTQANNVFLNTRSTVAGTVDSFLVTDLRVPYTTTSTETPKAIPSDSSSVFTNLSFRIISSNLIACSVPLQQGWNLVSVPINAADMSTGSFFPDANSPAYGYTDKYDIVTTLENGKGYWIRYPATDTMNLSGYRVNSTTIPIKAGWNLVGAYDRNVAINSITTTPYGVISSPFYGYTDKYEIPTMMEVGKSYWVRASDSGVIDISSALAKRASQAEALNQMDSKWTKVIVSDSKRNQSIVYATNESIDLDNYALPPLPPSGVFDVRWATDQLVDKIDAGGKDLFIHSAEYPITLKVEGGDVSINDDIGGKIVDFQVRDGQTLVIANPAVDEVQVKSLVYPSTFALYQNYPNPFNPSTTISYQLPAFSHVTLIVYDVLGREVATLVNEYKKMGNYAVEFNATNLSSGVYFYRLQTGPYHDTKKLLLLK